MLSEEVLRWILRIMKEGACTERCKGPERSISQGAIRRSDSGEQFRKESVEVVRRTQRMVSFPENVVDTNQTDFRTSNDPCAEGIISLRVYMTREGMRAIPVNNHQNEE